MQNIKVAVVGCGYWGKNLVRNFAELNALGAVCDVNPEMAQAAGKAYGVDVYTIDQVVNSDVDGVVIATPAAQHFEVAARALKAGKHVYVEKPLALLVEDAQKLTTLAAEVNRTLMVGHLLQYHPAFLELKRLIAIGNLGRLQYIYSSRLNLGRFRNEENILWNFAPHDISMILSIAGNELPETVHASGVCHLNPKIHDITTTNLSFKNGIQAHIFVSWLHPYKEQKLVVVGERGMAVFDDGLPWDQKLKVYPHHINWIEGLPQAEKAEVINVELDPQEPLRLECQHFLDCIAEKHRARTDGEEGTKVLQVLDAAQRSLMSKDTIVLNPTIVPYYKHETSVVDEGCEIGKGSKVWHYSHIIKGTKIGEDCVIGQNVMIGPDVVIGNRCKIQNNVSLYKGVTIEDGVFCGPSAVFTNVHNPRATVERKDEFRLTHVAKGATIGANATIICGNNLGAYCLIGAGAVVTKDVKAHAVMIGNPARHIGWVSHAGEKLGNDLVCPREGRLYKLTADNNLEEIEQHDRSFAQA